MTCGKYDNKTDYKIWYNYSAINKVIIKNFKINFTIMAKETFELFDDRVLVKPNPAEEKTKGGIIIPDTAKEKPQKGTVVAVGKGKYAEQTGTIMPLQVKAGDTVLYGKYGGTEITIEGVDYLIMRASDILMKVK
jgi:chaperonin GroES